MNNITRNGDLDLRDLKYMDLHQADHEKYLVRAGDVLFNRTNSAELVGKTAIVPASAPPLAYAGYLVRLRVNEANHPMYLARFLNTPYAKRMLRGMCKSIVGMANINAKEIQAMRIGLAPLPLQQTFATRIASIEALKATHRHALAALDALFASLQQRAFAGAL
jgi:type I restriction enzyme S subunit